MQIEIESIGYKRNNAASLVSKFPFAQLEVNQSFFVPDSANTGVESTKRGNLPVKAANVVLAPKKFKVRAEAKNGVPGRRVFRVE